MVACSSGNENSGDEGSEAEVSGSEITKIVLTPSEQEQGNLTLFELSEELIDIGLTENPGYANPEAFLEFFKIKGSPRPSSVYLVFYTREDSHDIAAIITATFSPKDVNAAMSAFYPSLINSLSLLHSYHDALMILNKENTVVVVISEFDSLSAEYIADKLSKRLSLEVFGLDRISEACVFSTPSFNCTGYSVTDSSIELVLKNTAGREMVVREVIATSDVLQDSCRTGKIEKPLSHSSEDRFFLNEIYPGSACTYWEDWREKNQYSLQVSYTWGNSTNLLHRAKGVLFASGFSS